MARLMKNLGGYRGDGQPNVPLEVDPEAPELDHRLSECTLEDIFYIMNRWDSLNLVKANHLGAIREVIDECVGKAGGT